jgi:hypothetical protein
MSVVEASPIVRSPIFYQELILKKMARIAKTTGKVEGISRIYLENQRFFLSGDVDTREIVFTLRSNLNKSLGKLQSLSQAFEERVDLHESGAYKYFQAFKKMILPLIEHSALADLEYLYIESVLNGIIQGVGSLPIDIDSTDEKLRRCWNLGVSSFSSIKESFDTSKVQLSRKLLSLVIQKVDTFQKGIRPFLPDEVSAAPFGSNLPDFLSCSIIDISPTPDDYLREDPSIGLFPLLVNIGLVESIIAEMAERESLVPSSLHCKDSVLIFALELRTQMEVKLDRIEDLLKEGADSFLAVQVSAFRDKFDKISSWEWLEYITKEVLINILDTKAGILEQRIKEKSELKQVEGVQIADLDQAQREVSDAWAEYSLALSDLRELFENHEEQALTQDIFQRHQRLVRLDKDDIYTSVDELQDKLETLIRKSNSLIKSRASRAQIDSVNAQIIKTLPFYHSLYARLMIDLKNRMSDPYANEVVSRHELLLEMGV